MRTPVTIACFGEILWDCLPRGLFLGGAPINVAYHLSRLGVRALPVTAIGRDVTARRAAEVKLRQERDYADAILASLPGAFYHFDQDGYVIRWNRNLERTSRYSADEVARMHVLDFIVDEDRARVSPSRRASWIAAETRPLSSSTMKSRTCMRATSSAEYRLVRSRLRFHRIT